MLCIPSNFPTGQLHCDECLLPLDELLAYSKQTLLFNQLICLDKQQPLATPFQ